MSDTINRWKSRRDRLGSKRVRGENKETLTSRLQSLFSNYDEVASQKESEKKIKQVSDKLAEARLTTFNESDIVFALKSLYANGDVDRAFGLLVLLEESEEGIVTEYLQNTKLLGAVNRNNNTCYLDSILFAMFVGLESFEAMLHNTFDDPHRKRLGTLLRLWVNTLRKGQLITLDITKQLQEALAECGWAEAAEARQQDASEAFGFITGKLELPMLTLKMDIFHTGREDTNDDHKFVHERLLEVAIPDDPQDGSPLTLEACLETYFNSRVEVKRYLALQRRATMGSTTSRGRSFDSLSKNTTIHIETVEIDDSQSLTPTSQHPSPPRAPLRPSLLTKERTPSIIQEHYVDDTTESPSSKGDVSIRGSVSSQKRAGSLRKEVVMPAWQFFSLIPWYTDAVPNSDAQVAAHFSDQRPVLGICLKRYSINSQGQAVRRGTHIDIPIEIGLPHFIHDDDMSEEGAAFGNFKLSLQSVVCHRGKSVHSGHYVSLVRGQTLSTREGKDSSRSWMLFDDLAKERIRYVDIKKAMKEESPYLLFYQVQPIDSEPDSAGDGDRPSSSTPEDKDSGVAGLSLVEPGSQSSSDTPEPLQTGSLSGSLRSQVRRGRSSMSVERPLSITFDASTFEHPPPNMLTAGTGSVLPSRRVSLSTKNNFVNYPSSDGHDKRFSVSLTRLADKLTMKERPEATIGGAEPGAVDAAAVVDTEPKPPPPVEKSKAKKEAKRRDRLLSKNRGDKLDRECAIM